MIHESPKFSRAASLGQSLGQGIGSGLDLLVSSKLKSMQDEKKMELASQLKRQEQAEKMNQLLSLLGPSGSSEEVVEGELTTSQAPGGREITDEQIMSASLVDPNFARILQSQKEAKEKRTEKRREISSQREYERAKPIFQRADERAEQQIPKANALAAMKNALQEGNLGYFSPDNLAELTGIEAFRTPKGAEFISSGKEFFLGSLKRAGARPNMWIEKQIQKMLPKIGRSKEANLSVVALLESEQNVENAYQEILNRLEAEDKAKYGEVKGNIGRRANAEVQKFANQEQKRLEKELRQIQKSPENTTLLIDPSGNVRRVENKDVKAAKAAGYKLKK